MRDLKSIPLQELCDDMAELKTDEDVRKYNLTSNEGNFYNRHNLKDKEEWLLPQLNAKFASFKLTKNESGKIDGLKFWTTNVDMGSKWAKGLYYLALTLNRGFLVKKQNKPQGLRYCALVPLILAAHKDFNGINYSDWDPSSLKYVVDKYLLDAMLPNPDLKYSYTKEELLDFRDTARTGKNHPYKKKPITGMHSVSNVGDSHFDKLPKLAKIMLIQAWVANQTLRNDLMVLDPLNWDNMPDPLIDGDIIELPYVAPPKHKITATDVWGV